MWTIVLQTGQENPEDDIYELVELLKKRFTGQTLNVSSALVVETDIEPVAKLLATMPTIQVDNLGAKKAEKKYKCTVCGAPVSKSGKRCRSCAAQKRREVGHESIA